MTATLYLDVSVYPLAYGADVTLYADVWLATDFLNPPSGSTAAPGASPDGSTTVDVVLGGTACSITGLDNTKSYWLRLFNPQGYSHWFPVSWTTGNSALAPQVVGVPAIEGPIVSGGISRITSDNSSVTVTNPMGPTTDLSAAGITEITADSGIIITNPTGPITHLATGSMLVELYFPATDDMNASVPRDARGQYNSVVTVLPWAYGASGFLQLGPLVLNPKPSLSPSIFAGRLFVSDMTGANTLEAVWPGALLVSVGADGTGWAYNLPTTGANAPTVTIGGTDLSMSGLTVTSAAGGVYGVTLSLAITP